MSLPPVVHRDVLLWCTNRYRHQLRDSEDQHILIKRHMHEVVSMRVRSGADPESERLLQHYSKSLAELEVKIEEKKMEIATIARFLDDVVESAATASAARVGTASPPLPPPSPLPAGAANGSHGSHGSYGSTGSIGSYGSPGAYEGPGRGRAPPYKRTRDEFETNNGVRAHAPHTPAEMEAPPLYAGVYTTDITSTRDGYAQEIVVNVDKLPYEFMGKLIGSRGKNLVPIRTQTHTRVHCIMHSYKGKNIPIIHISGATVDAVKSAASAVADNVHAIIKASEVLALQPRQPRLPHPQNNENENRDHHDRRDHRDHRDQYDNQEEDTPASPGARVYDDKDDDNDDA